MSYKVMPEKIIQSKIMLHCGRLPGVRLFRNNTGVALAINKGKGHWTAILNACVALCRKMGGSAAPIKYGLHEGSGDLIGWQTVAITHDMVGHKIARFVSVEVKEERGRLSDEQEKWLANVRAAGGVGIVARSVEDVVEGLR